MVPTYALWDGRTGRSLWRWLTADDALEGLGMESRCDWVKFQSTRWAA
jgi:hypothetical protein